MTTPKYAIRNLQSAIEAIQRHWQLKSLRPLQHEALECHLMSCDSLVVMPTGAGKSLCYQAPPVLFKSTVVVITPLIALMTDQVIALAHREIPAACLNSMQQDWDQAAIGRRFVAGDLRLLYVAPERFVSPKMLAMILQAEVVDSIVVDEAHCISQWGHDFRPDYAKLGAAIAAIRQQRPAISVHAYTATATPQVREEIVESLNLRPPSAVSYQRSAVPKSAIHNPQSPVVLIGDFDRPNLFLGVIRRTAIDDQLLTFVRNHRGDSGIIYCPRRVETERIARLLTEASIKAVAYHAGLGGATRRAAQAGFMAGRYDVMVATIAFGMGIDIPDIRYVLHAMMPSSLETYHQEIGRAGRDGRPAECVIFHHPSDYGVWQTLLEETGSIEGIRVGDEDPLASKIASLMEMHHYCRADIGCRHFELLLHFGQAGDLNVNCGACDICVPLGATHA